MQGHLLKYKKADGTWVSIPVLYQSMYQAYVDYCNANGIEDVAKEDTYYATVGTLKTLVDQLKGSTGSLTHLINILQASGGVVPVTMGGTGLSLTAFATLADYLKTAEQSGGAGFVTTEDVANIKTEYNMAINAAFNKFVIDDCEPKDSAVLQDNKEALYYFQI